MGILPGAVSRCTLLDTQLTQAVPADGAAVLTASIAVNDEPWPNAPTARCRGQDAVRWPVRLGGQLDYLAGGISSSDFAPTAQQREMAAKDLASFNSLLRRTGLKPVEAPAPATVP